MADRNLILYVASYLDEDSASQDFTLLKSASDLDELKVVAAAVVSRDEDGKVKVKEHQAGRAVRDMGWGAVGGLLVGLFSAPLLASTAIGAGLGAAMHEIMKHHDEKEIGRDLEGYLDDGSSAILAILDDTYADRLDRVLTRADKRITRAIDSGDYDRLVRALEHAGYEVTKGC